MRERALVHVAGPAGAGKTAFVEALIADLRDRGDPVLAARCVRDDRLRAPRETAPKAHPELRRYLEAGATGAALFAFPEKDETWDAFFVTHLMEDYSEAVALEGDSPVEFVDLAVFVAPPPAPGRTLLVRKKRDRAKEERRKAEALLRLLRKPGGAAEVLVQMVGGPFVDCARANPRLFEEARLELLAGIAGARKAPPPPPTEHWALAEGYEGLERAQLVVVNIRAEAERPRAEELVADVGRLRKEPALFEDVLRTRGTRIPVTAVVANLADPEDRGRKKALARVRRALPAGR
jgi:GTPase SAR1 family protein